MKEKINIWDYAGTFSAAMKQGILLTTKADNKVNTMTIGWGTVGIQWGKPIFIAFVRQSRHTKTMLDQTGEFTINAPLSDVDKHILGFCGTKSGRDLDKIAELGLTLEAPTEISVPGIKELPLTLECKVLYQQDQVMADIPQDIIDRYYPDLDDHHTAYYAEILDAYVIR